MQLKVCNCITNEMRIAHIVASWFTPIIYGIGQLWSKWLVHARNLLPIRKQFPSHLYNMYEYLRSITGSITPLVDK